MGLFFYFLFSGKSLISKEKAIQAADKQDLKQNPDPVFFISLVGVDKKGNVDQDEHIYNVGKYEHIFDIYTKWYDFVGSNVKVLSAQDLRDFYKSKHQGKVADVYQMAEFFVDEHSNGHFILDECPFKYGKGK